MAGITDSAFRRMCKGYGADVVVSEMISATALFHDDDKTKEMMRFDRSERPYVGNVLFEFPPFGGGFDTMTMDFVSANFGTCSISTTGDPSSVTHSTQ